MNRISSTSGSDKYTQKGLFHLDAAQQKTQPPTNLGRSHVMTARDAVPLTD